MKQAILTFAIAIIATVTVNAQNLGRQHEWLTKAPYNIPMSKNNPYYDTVVRLGNEFPQEALLENAKYYFEHLFGSILVKQKDENTYTGANEYYFSTGNTNDPEFLYKVSYILEIEVKDGQYVASMHDFILEHNNTQVNFKTKYKQAVDDDALAKRMLAYFNRKNLDELRKVHNSMKMAPTSNLGTASK